MTSGVTARLFLRHLFFRGYAPSFSLLGVSIGWKPVFPGGRCPHGAPRPTQGRPRHGVSGADPRRPRHRPHFPRGPRRAGLPSQTRQGADSVLGSTCVSRVGPSPPTLASPSVSAHRASPWRRRNGSPGRTTLGPGHSAGVGWGWGGAPASRDAVPHPELRAPQPGFP